MKIICLKETTFGKFVYICSQKQLNNDDYGSKIRRQRTDFA